MNKTLSKNEFLEKYKYSESTYQRRMSKLKNTEIFCDAYIRPTSREVRIDVELYEQFLRYESCNRILTRKVSPATFLAEHCSS